MDSEVRRTTLLAISVGGSGRSNQAVALNLGGLDAWLFAAAGKVRAVGSPACAADHLRRLPDPLMRVTDADRSGRPSCLTCRRVAYL